MSAAKRALEKRDIDVSAERVLVAIILIVEDDVFIREVAELLSMIGAIRRLPPTTLTKRLRSCVSQHIDALLPISI